MIKNFHNIVLLCAALALVLALTTAPASSAELGERSLKVIKLPKLFDFGYFKRSFNKNYGSILEDLARRKYYLSRALRVVVSGLNFILGKLSYHLALNEMSDYSPAEVAMRMNRAEVANELLRQQRQAQDEGRKLWPEPRSEHVFQELDISDEELAKKLQELIKAHPNERAYKTLLDQQQQQLRSKRSPGERNHPIRQLSVDDLFKRKQEADEYANERSDKRIKLLVPSNNPYYVERPEQQPSNKSLGQQERHEKVNWYRVQGVGDPQTTSQANSFLNQISKYLSEPDGKQKIDAMIPQIVQENRKLAIAEEQQFENEIDKQDEIFVDHRGSCMGIVRQQGKCGSCYAFASIALLEWIHCRHTGLYTPFSEQYIIDCGHYVKGLDGCAGGDRLSVVEFIHNFGAELRFSYPYRTRQDECPYPPTTELKTTGYIRPNLGSALIVPRRKWANYIKYTPLLTSIFTSDDFFEYGGGVHELKNCDKEDGHAMLLVGHGREQGQQYWLLRNSFSVGWGEKGYYKLAKKSDPECIFMEAYTIGTPDGVNFEAKPEINKLNDKLHIMRHNEEHLRRFFANGAF